jgi:hypothetical protein
MYRERAKALKKEESTAGSAPETGECCPEGFLDGTYFEVCLLRQLTINGQS